MSEDLCLLTATALLEGYRTQTLSPVEVTNAVLARIETLNPRAERLQSGLGPGDSTRRRPRRRAGRAGSRRACSTACRCRSRTSSSPRAGRRCAARRRSIPKGPWNDDAPATARLREHGAVLLGKTTTPEFGWKGVTDSPLTGITRNPWNPDEDARRLLGRRGGRGGRRHGSARGRHRRRRLDPHPVQLHRPLRHQALVRPRAGVAAVAFRHGGARRADDAHASPTRR